DSTNIAALNNLITIYLYLGRHADAERVAETVIRLRPLLAGAYGLLATLRFREGSLPAALATVDSGMAQLPEWATGHLEKARFALSRRDLAAADSFTRSYGESATGVRSIRDYADLRIWRAALSGRLRDAEHVVAEPGWADPITRASTQGALDIMRGDTAAAVARVQQALAQHEADYYTYFEAIFVLTYGNAADAADAVLAAWKAEIPDDQLGLGGRMSRELAIAWTLR